MVRRKCNLINETVLLSTQNKIKFLGILKKIIAVLGMKNYPYLDLWLFITGGEERIDLQVNTESRLTYWSEN